MYILERLRIIGISIGKLQYVDHTTMIQCSNHTMQTVIECSLLRISVDHLST